MVRKATSWHSIVASSAVAACLCLTPSALGSEPTESLLPRDTVSTPTKQAIEHPDFQRHVAPLLGTLGCNGRACHGSFQGRGGLRLSLFGYDFAMDYAALTGGSSESAAIARVDKKAIESSLILAKPTLAVDHEGGERFAKDSWQYQLLHNWIEQGASWDNEAKELTQLVVQPQEVVFDKAEAVEGVEVTAVWNDGSREVVTPLCRFRTNNDAIVDCDEHGHLTAVGPGDSHVIVFYDNGVAAIPVSLAVSSQRPAVDLPHPIDRLVDQKLAKLGIEVSEICTDEEFLRRVSIDLTGSIPSPDEVHAFLADRALEKRSAKIQELLERPEYAAWWATRLCDFTGCNPRQQAELGLETAQQWYEWMRRRVADNTPYDQIVAGIVTANSRRGEQSYDEYAAEVSSYFRDVQPTEFARRPDMPHYWSRRSVEKPEDKALAVAHNFLGVRLQCAQCHKHPWDQWTQGDFEQFAAFFETVNYGVREEDREQYNSIARRSGMQVRGDNGTPVRPDSLAKAQDGRTIAWREVYVQPRSELVALSLLRAKQVTLSPDSDPRIPIMDWMRSPSNPYFAKAIVNRIWASHLGQGIIEPTDDLNPANPPSNPALLEWLEREFIDNQFDLKWLHYQILSSDTYQRSWRPQPTNRDDDRNFSRYIPHRIPAEVLYDVLKQATASDEHQVKVRNDFSRRATGLLSMRMSGTYAMNIFGKPDRGLNCDCERVNDPTLLQAVFMQNDPLVRSRIADSAWIAEVVAKADPDATKTAAAEIVRKAYVRTLSRYPKNEELARGERLIRESASTEQALQSLLWALVNTKEFVLQH